MDAGFDGMTQNTYDGDRNFSAHGGIYPIEFAIKSGNLDCIKVILAHETSEQMAIPIEKAITGEGGIEVLKYLLEVAHKDTEYRQLYERITETALHKATKKGKIDMMKLLMEYLKGDKNPPDRDHFGDGRTPLHEAARNKCQNINVFKVLLENIDGDQNPKDKKGITPLHIAAEFDNLEIVELLLRTIKGNKNPPDDSGTTPLQIAIKQENVKVVELLLKELQEEIPEGNSDTRLAESTSRAQRIDELVENDRKRRKYE